MFADENAFTLLQKDEVRKAVQAGLSEEAIQLVRNEHLNYRQMAVIRSALESGMDIGQVRAIGRHWVSADEMQELLDELRNGQTVRVPTRPLPLAAIARVSAALLLGVTLLLSAFARHPKECGFELTGEEIRLSVGMEYHPEAYVKEIHGEDVSLIMPEAFTAETPGVRIAAYELEADGVRIRKLLRIVITDETPPELTLTTDHIELLRVTPFACESYIVSAVDNVDGDITDRVTCDSTLGEAETQNVTYSVTDAAGNTGTASLEVHFAELPDSEPEVIETPAPAPVRYERPVPKPQVPSPVQTETAPAEVPAEYETIITEEYETLDYSDAGSESTVVEHRFG